jgi:DNA-binding NarL/FixJ family response regulator
MPHILIADNCEVIRAGVRRILEAQADLQIIGEAADGKEALDKAIALQPDVAIVEIALPGMNGIDVTKHVRRHLPHTEICIFTQHEEELWVPDGLRAGARGYVFKSDPGYCLLDATRTLAAHEPYFSSKITALLLRSCRAPRQPASAAALKRSRPESKRPATSELVTSLS